MTGKKFPRRGEIYWVNLDPTIGSETKKLRPCLIVSNDLGNELSKMVMIAPITSKIKNVYPFEVEATIAGKPAKIMLNQCRAIDKSRIAGFIEEVDIKIKLVDEAIKLVFGIN